MKITNDGYPVKIELNYKRKLPPFKYGCKTRTKILRGQLHGKDLGHHSVNDFIVETVTETKDGELWGVGS